MGTTRWTRRQVLATPPPPAMVGTGCLGFGTDSAPDPEPFPDEWHSVGGDSTNTGFAEQGAVGSGLEEVWAIPIESRWLAGSPIVGGGRLYLVGPDQVRTISLSSSEQETADFGATATPAFDDGLFVPSNEDDGKLVVLTKDGTRDWAVELPGEKPFAPTVDGDAIAIRTETAIAMVDRQNQTVEWSIEVTEQEQTHFRGFHRAPALTDKFVVVPVAEGIECRDRRTGDLVWRKPIGEVWSSPAVDDGTVYVSAAGYGIAALDLETGDEHWHVNANESSVSPAVGPDTIYATAGFDVFAINRESGQVRWETGTHGLRGDIFSDLIALQDGVIAGSSSQTAVVFAASDGTRREEIDGYGTFSSHAFSEGYLLAQQGEKILAFEPV